ncbi:hypothetical protein VTO42DRAFT_7474 [Malbranchea cinnamomea]
MSQTINVLLSSFPGLSLPSTLTLPLPSTSTIANLTEQINSLLPLPLLAQRSPLILTTTNNKQLQPNSLEPLCNFVTSDHDAAQPTFLPLRLSARLCGGKGGFGSQLRAAGGRMSSRRKGARDEDNGSNRTLDGRRVRTVKEAKALAEYLALKPDMDRKEKEARRKRWEMIVEAAERREEELRNGESKGKVDGAWMEDKEEVNERAREAVLRAMKDGAWRDYLAGSPVGGSSSSASEGNLNSGSTSPTEDSEMDDVDEEYTGSSSMSQAKKSSTPRKYFGFDDDDDDDDDDELLSDEEEERVNGGLDGDVKGKGKEKAC